jgi:hypothetical protein
MKQSKPFSFTYPLKHKVVRDLKIVTECLGSLIIEGTAYLYPNRTILDFDKYGADIDFVKWQGQDIKTILEIYCNMDEITEAAVRHAATLFNQADATVLRMVEKLEAAETEPTKEYSLSLYEQMSL